MRAAVLLAPLLSDIKVTWFWFSTTAQQELKGAIPPRNKPPRQVFGMLTIRLLFMYNLRANSIHPETNTLVDG